MSDEEPAFLRAVSLHPQDAVARLVYADWLDDRGDPRGEYLRLLCAAAGWQEPAADREQVVGRLQHLGVGLAPDWVAAVQQGVNWRTLFEANLLPPDLRADGAVYEFNPPAAAEQLAAAEQALGFRLPDDVRGMWSEFNGVRYTTATDRRLGNDPELFFLDLETMPEAADVLRENGWDEVFADEYGEEVLGKLAFIRGYDGWSQVWAVCAAEVAGHPAGTVIHHDHDTPELNPLYPSLTECVRRFHQNP
jgi:uncharacterized protein (TIGR02996 family)